MRKINKIILATTFVVLGILITFLVIYQRGKAVLNLDKQSIDNEIEYAQETRKEIEKKPFLTKLPIKTTNYTVVYSSLKKEIVVIFEISDDSLDTLKTKFFSEVENKLLQTGVDPNSQNISWEVEI